MKAKANPNRLIPRKTTENTYNEQVV